MKNPEKRKVYLDPNKVVPVSGKDGSVSTGILPNNTSIQTKAIWFTTAIGGRNCGKVTQTYRCMSISQNYLATYRALYFSSCDNGLQP